MPWSYRCQFNATQHLYIWPCAPDPSSTDFLKVILLFLLTISYLRWAPSLLPSLLLRMFHQSQTYRWIGNEPFWQLTGFAQMLIISNHNSSLTIFAVCNCLYTSIDVCDFNSNRPVDNTSHVPSPFYEVIVKHIPHSSPKYSFRRSQIMNL